MEARCRYINSMQTPDHNDSPDPADLVQELALAGGQAIRACLPTEGLVEKQGRGNFLTAADQASERAILALLAESFPDDAILSEESRPNQADPLTVPRLWVIDPLDGTNNFRFDRHFCAVSVGYVEAGELKAGAVYDPFREELFFAARGQGAFCNGVPIRVGQEQRLPSASVATDNCYDPAGTRRNLELLLRIEPPPWVLVRGSAALTLCEIACGRTDLYFHTALQPWDVAAGFLIVREAGGQVCQFDGSPADLLTAAAITGNDALVQECLPILRVE